jgi:hypothetical protein
MAGAFAVETRIVRCGRCGRMSPVTASFCPRCGVRLRDVSPVLHAEILDAEPVPSLPPPLPRAQARGIQGQWEVLEPPRIAPVYSIPGVPVIPPAPPLPGAYRRPTWSPTFRSQPKKRRPWLYIALGIFVIRALAAVGSHSSSDSNSPSNFNFPTSPRAPIQPYRPPKVTTPVYQPHHPPTVTTPKSGSTSGAQTFENIPGTSLYVDKQGRIVSGDGSTPPSWANPKAPAIPPVPPVSPRVHR